MTFVVTYYTTQSIGMNLQGTVSKPLMLKQELKSCQSKP